MGNDSLITTIPPPTPHPKCCASKLKCSKIKKKVQSDFWGFFANRLMQYNAALAQKHAEKAFIYSNQALTLQAAAGEPPRCY